MNFERNLKSSDALEIGVKTSTDKKILEMLEAHANNQNSPVVIQHLEITEDYHIAVYYAPTSDEINPNMADLYWRKYLRDSNLNFFIENIDTIFSNHPSLDYIKIIKYPIKVEYQYAFEPGRIYEIEDNTIS